MSPRIPIQNADDEDDYQPDPEELTEPTPAEATTPAQPEAAPTPAEDWPDRYLRLQADFTNYRRHAEAERSRLLGLGREAALADIFPLLDHLERGLAWAREHGAEAAVIEGLTLTQKEFEKVLDRHGIKRMSTLGEPFNPELHEAVSVLAREGVEPGRIVEEVAAGFSREGKVLRPARVVVAE
jgi:molecular chaperone GrpE